MRDVLRVLFITVVPSPYQRDLFRALAARQELALSVCYLEAASPDSPWPAKPLAQYERVLPGFWFSFARGRWHINWDLPDETQYDFVVVNNFASLTAQWLMRRRLRGKRWIFWAERLRTQQSGWKEKMQRLLVSPLGRARAIVGIGSVAEQDYHRRFPAIPHFSIPYHTDLSEFLRIPRPVLARESVTFLYCGQMIARKGVDLLLRAFERLVDRGFEVALLLVGREADLASFLQGVSAKTRERISYEGFQPPERLSEFFARADVFVLASRYDGWGVVINQALGAGLPVISSDAAGAAFDLVEDGVNGLRFAAGDEDGLERTMEVLAGSPERLREWGDASRRKAVSIVPSVGAQKWVDVFRELDKNPSASCLRTSA